MLARSIRTQHRSDPMSNPSIFRDDLFKDQVVFVTGGGSGICRGITERFLAHGAHAAITSRKQERLDAAAAEMREATGQKVLPVAADVRDPEAVSAAIAKTIETFGRIDVVVNGAAGNFLCPAAGLSPKGFRTVMEIDAGGTFNVSRAAFDAYLQEHGGCIINISATLQFSGTPFQIHAASAKAAVDQITRTLAVEWGPLGIRTNAVAPGPIDNTEGMTRLAPADMKEKLEKLIPAQRFGTIREVADATLFIASPAASYVNGEIFVVDGGQWLATAGFGGVM